MSWWQKLLIALGIVSVVAATLMVIVIAYLLIAKPFPVSLWQSPGTATTTPGGVATTTFDHPLLSPQQEKFLETVGIDPKTIPTSVTPAQEACAVQQLGAERVAQIKAGAEITTVDYFKAKSCFNK